jgi:Tfp pilus assembly protein PilF
VSEKEEVQDTGPEAAAGIADPAAVALALSGASRERADAFLKRQEALIEDQRRLVGLQAQELSHELKLRHWSLWVRHFSGVLKLTLEVSLALTALALVGVVAASVWNAAHSDGLIIESFTVPPDMAARGVTGEEVAGQLQDKLNAIQADSGSASAEGRSIKGSGGDDIKLEIPETGISVGEAWRFLRRWLGHETMVGGELYRTPDGLAVRVQVGSDGATISGPEADLDGLMQKAAEHVEAVMQPASYGGYLETRDPPRVAEAQAILERAASDPAQSVYQRSRALNNLGLLYDRFKNDTRTNATMLRRSNILEPGYPVPLNNLARAELDMGHAETALGLQRASIKAMDRVRDEMVPDAFLGISAAARLSAAALVGDFGEAVRQGQTGAEQLGAGGRRDRLQRLVAEYLARQHDSSAVRDRQRQMPPPPTPRDAALRSLTWLQVEAGLANWQNVLVTEAVVQKTISSVPGVGDIPLLIATQLHPVLAEAKAMTGDVAGAEAAIATTPGDCYDCVRTRGLIAAAEKQWGRADYWFARAVQQAPSLPFGYTDWGVALLERGKPDDAIEKFKLAYEKGPHFADPIEMWGEALMAQNQSHLALAKFAEAEKYAPNWGRLHLKWGEALVYAGKGGEAKVQFARAAQLDLTRADKAELARQSPHV